MISIIDVVTFLHILCREAQETIAFQKDYIARLTAQLRDAREKAGLSASAYGEDASENVTSADMPPSLQDIAIIQPLFQAYDSRISVSSSCCATGTR